MEIVLDHVSKKIKNNLVLDNLNQTFKSGCIYGLKGYNGSGKTMLLRLLCGLIHPTQGNVSIDGKVLGKDMDYPPSVGMLIENPAFLENFSAFKNLKMIASLNQVIDDAQIEAVLDAVGLKESMHIKYKKFSLGMKQRLGIAAAIMENPNLLVLDEPTNALDKDGVHMVSELIKKMKDEQRIIVLASHEQEFLNDAADIIFDIENGRIRQAGEEDALD